MKRVFIMLAIVLGSAGLLFAQKSNQKEVKQLQSFLQQKSAKGDANYIRLGITDIKNPAMWKGVVWSDGRAISIDWKDKELAGELDLNGFTALQKVDCSRNQLTEINVSNCTALNTLNVSRNKLSELNIDNCPALIKLDCYKNRLTDLSLSGLPGLKNLNCSNNLFVELNVNGAQQLQSLNVQGCHLESLSVD
ncbi:leucine-rich repeat domain-containing protein, partial [Barnesiella intestinihominis]